MTGSSSLDARYFEGIFATDDDPWNLASSDYEAAKFDASIAAIADRRYRRALEVGCAHGVLTARLATLCDWLLAIDISATALRLAGDRVRDLAGITFERMAFPGEVPQETGFDLVVLSEVAYYWSHDDLDRAARWLSGAIVPGGRVLLVHWTGETDYPQSGEGAVEAIRHATCDEFDIKRADRTDRYRLDLWTRR